MVQKLFDKEKFNDKENVFEAMPIKWINQSRRTGRGPADAKHFSWNIY